jgi:O-antigen ligase
VTAAVARLTDPRYPIAAGILLLTMAIGVLAGYEPKLAIAAAFGLAFVVIAIGDLAVGVAIFGTLTYLELAPVAGGGPAVSFAKLAGLTLAISWIATLTTGRGARARLFFTSHPAMTAAMVFFVVWAALSATWAEDPGPTSGAVGRLALNVALVPIIFTALQQAKHLRWVAVGIVAGAFLAATYGLIAAPNAAEAAVSVTAAGDLNRISGTVGDPNMLASVLVVGIVMALTLCLDRTRSAPLRIACIGVALLSMSAVFATASRGGIVALGAALFAAVILGGPLRPRLALAAVTVVVFSVGYFAIFASQAQVNRLSISDGGAGRTDIWKVGWRMVEANPLHGVGAGNFPVSSIHYLLEPGAIQQDEFIVDRPAVAHNMYLEVLAELGIVGLTLFLSFILISLAAGIRAARKFDHLGEDGLALIARGIAVGLISTLAADVFLSNEVGKLLWLLIALGPATLSVATLMTKRAEEEAEAPALTA